MIVSKPVKIEIEIEDLITHCTYVYSGEYLEDCIDYFQSLFFDKRPYKIIRKQYF